MANPWDNDEIIAPPQQTAAAEPWASDRLANPTMLQAGARGLGLQTRDVLEGVVGPIYDLAAAPINAVASGVRALTGSTNDQPLVRPFSQNLDAIGLPRSETPTEKAISAVQQPVAGTLTGLGVGRVLTSAANPLLQAAGGALTAQPGMQAAAAGVGGAVTEATDSPVAGLAASVATPLAARGLGVAGRAVENAALGGGLSKGNASLGRLAQDKYGIPINAADMTDNSILRIGADQLGKLPFSGTRKAAEVKHAAWQGAIAKEMGEDATAFQPHVMDRARTRIGQTFEDVATRTNIPAAETKQLVADLDGIASRADRIVTAGEVAPLQRQIADLKELIAKNNGEISGEVYQRLTRAHGDLALLEKDKGNLGEAAGWVRDALDDAFSRSATTADKEALQQARYQYRVMRTVDQLAAGSRDGNITPEGFKQKVLTASRRYDQPTGGMAYTGGGNLGELARIGNLMRAAPQTGTADRMAVNMAGLAGLSGLASITPTGAAVTAAGLAANRAAQSYLRSPATANRLIENAIGPSGAAVDPYQAALRASTVAGVNRLLQQD